MQVSDGGRALFYVWRKKSFLSHALPCAGQMLGHGLSTSRGFASLPLRTASSRLQDMAENRNRATENEAMAIASN